MERHPMIEFLHWDVTAKEDVAANLSNTLPFLREISGDSEHVLAFLSHRSAAPRPLHSITNIAIDAAFWENVRPGLDSRRILKLDVEQFGCIGDIYRLAKEFPNLSWLRVDLSDVIWDDTTRTWRTMITVSTGKFTLVIF